LVKVLKGLEAESREIINRTENRTVRSDKTLSVTREGDNGQNRDSGNADRALLVVKNENFIYTEFEMLVVNKKDAEIKTLGEEMK